MSTYTGPAYLAAGHLPRLVGSRDVAVSVPVKPRYGMHPFPRSQRLKRGKSVGIEGTGEITTIAAPQ
jgi:hypothetical protein